MKFLPEILIFFGIVLSAFIGRGHFDFLKYKKQNKKVNDAVNNNPKISLILEKLEELPEVKKAVLIKIHNSGMKIITGDMIKGTIILPLKWQKSFNNQILDKEYLNEVVSPILDKNKIHLRIQDLNGHLKSMFIVQGVKSSICYLIKVLPEKFFFVAVDLNCSNDEISYKSKDDIRVAINEVRKLMI